MSNVVALRAPSRDMTSQYADWLSELGCSRATIDQRTDFMVRVTQMWGTPAPATSVMTEWLSRFHGWTRRTYAGHLMSIHRWMLEDGQLDRLPLERYKRPPIPNPKPMPLTREQLEAALDTDDKRLRAWLLLGYLAGLRAHELAKFHGRDIDERTVFVRGKGGDESMLPTHPALWALAQDFPRDDYWFPSPEAGHDHVSPELVSLRIRQRFREIGVTRGAAHRLRYTYATHLSDSGAPIRVIQELLRHRSLETTMRYVGVNDEAMRGAINALAA